MIKKSPYLILGIVTSITIYFSLILLLGFYFYKSMQKPKVYALKKETVLEITLESLPKEPDIKEVKKEKKEPKPLVKNDTASKDSEAGGSISPKKSSPNLKSLFASLDVTKPKKIINEVPIKKDHIASRFKSKDIESVKRPKLDISKLVKNISISKSVISFEKKGGEIQDDYYSEIYKILAENWIPDSSNIGHVARVLVIVDNLGNFDYKIKKLSNNDSFNQKLIQFLDSMKLKKFPPYEKGNKTVVEVYFKTEE